MKQSSQQGMKHGSDGGHMFKGGGTGLTQCSRSDNLITKNLC